MDKKSKTIDRCQISGVRDLKTVLYIGYLPPVNKLNKINSSLREYVFYPAELMFSPSSKLLQLSTIVDKKILFPKEYPYTSSTTKVLRENFKELYEECLKTVENNKVKENIQLMKIMRKYLDKYDFHKYVKPAKFFCPLDWWHTKDSFIPPCCRSKYGVEGYDIKSIFKEAYCVHLWRSLLLNRHKLDPNKNLSHYPVEVFHLTYSQPLLPKLSQARKATPA